MTQEEEIKRLNEKIEFLARTNMLYSDWEHRETQVTSDLIRKGMEASKLNVELLSLMQQALEALEYPGPSWPEARQSIAAALRAKLKEKNNAS